MTDGTLWETNRASLSANAVVAPASATAANTVAKRKRTGFQWRIDIGEAPLYLRSLLVLVVGFHRLASCAGLQQLLKPAHVTRQILQLRLRRFLHGVPR